MSTTTSAPATATDLRWVVFPTTLSDDPGKDLIGGKARSLWRMSHLGLQVPPAFTVTTEACAAYFEGDVLPDGLREELRVGIDFLQTTLGRRFGDPEAPLLVSVRSGAAISMPGMMDTILNLGINDEVEQGLGAETGSPDFAAEVNRRFHAFYGNLVLGCFEELDEHPDTAAVRAAIEAELGAGVPSDPWEQLEAAVAAVFRSSRTRRAIAYRQHHGIPEDLGTAVTVQAMVFGNLDDDSGTGVLFSRNPLNGHREPYGEYLPRGQGEDVVSGRVTPQPLDALAQRAPDVHAELLKACELLDAEGRDAQDIEFTVQHGTLYLLQSRPAKRTARAAVRIAVALVEEGVLSVDEALSRVNADQIRALLRPVVDTDAAAAATVLVRGTNASPGAAAGRAVGDSDEAVAAAEAGETVVLVRKNTSPEDVHGMIAAAAVVTEQGGSTSHAAVVSRALDTPCVVGCADAVTALVGREVTVDAAAGVVYAGLLPTTAVEEAGDDDLGTLLTWARERSPIQVVADAAEVDGPVLDAADLAQSGEVGTDGDPDAVPPIPSGTAAVAGACFTTPAGLRAVREAGVDTVVASPALPALLTALTLTEETR